MNGVLSEHNNDLTKILDSIFEAQARNNQARQRDLRSMATPGFLKVFDLAPTLLHFNHPELPGYLDHPETPHGLVGYDYWLMNSSEISIGPWTNSQQFSPVVECLVLIGSSGSVGHTHRSDLDYWVCYNPNNLKGRALALFKEKLQLVSNWALNEHQTEANFYLVNLAEVARGRIEHSWGEEADGEVAPHLLMEELYRTILFVAGRIPLWCVWPPDYPETVYRRNAEALAPLNWENSPPTYVDMGFPTKPQPQEYLASAMWLAYKSETDPFKGILKLIPILEAVETDFQSPLLCDLVKSEIINNPYSMTSVDPYIITIDRVIDFGSKNLSPEHLELLRTASVLKVLGLTGKPGEVLRSGIISPSKLRVLTKWMDEWGWPPDRVGHLAAYDQWTERERLRLGNDILMMLLGIYMRISSHLITRFPGQVNAQDEELAPFAARILGRQRGLEATVELLPSDLHRQSLSRRMIFQQDVLTGQWAVYNLPPNDASQNNKDSNGSNSSQDNKGSQDNKVSSQAQPEFAPMEIPEGSDIVFESERVAKAAAWLIRNQLYGDDLEVYVTDSFELTTPMLKAYLKALDDLFPAVEFYNLDTDTIWQVGAKGSVLIAFNLEDPTETKIRTMDAVFRTGWGEMRHQWKDLAGFMAEADKYLELGTMLFEVCGLLSVESLVLHPAQAETFNRAFVNLKAALMAHLRPRHQSKLSKSLIDL
ncbi:MAG: class I adenylate cyclase [Deltaproteobacteria bacterium]|jgi:adenylate cyclase|nr:class I adenylate cyclase [Deltaproteobacteria bacterium]